MTRINASALLLALLSVAACSSVAEGTGSSESNQTDAKPLTTVKGREYARCWFDVVGADAQLSCTSTARGSDPLAARVMVSVAGSSGFRKDLDIEAGGTVIAGSVPTNGFPRTVKLQVLLGSEAETMIGVTSESSWTSDLSVASPADLSAARPLALGQPFDLWPVGIVFAMTKGGGFSLKAHPYTHSSDPYRVGLAGARELTFEPSLAHFDEKIFYVVAPKAVGALPATQSLDAFTDGASYEKQTSLPGPGYWAVTDDGIRAATPEEIAKTFGDATAPSPVDPPTPVDPPAPVEPPTPVEPPAPVDTDPTCGGNQQATCAAEGGGRSCDAGTRSVNGTCYTCGANQQQACFADPNGTDASKGLKCDAGTRAVNGTCYTCGASGQQACYVDPNGASAAQGLTCNDGLRVVNGSCYP